MPSHPKRFLLGLASLALLCCAAAGCSRGGADQTEEANRLVDEMNTIKLRAGTLGEAAVGKDAEIEQKDLEKEGDEISAIAEEQVKLYRDAAAAYREAADRAERASRLRTDEWFVDYLDLNARHLRKLAEVMDVGREGAEAWVKEDSLDAIADKTEQTGERVAKLSKEVESLLAEIRKVEEEHKNEIHK